VASEVDICNLALGHLGDSATVSSINPPEGSAQAEHCARFYPIARDLTLESHDWGFATKRANLALLAITPPAEWRFAYQLPPDCRNPIDLLNPTPIAFFPGTPRHGNWEDTAYEPGPIPYELESLAVGTGVIYTNLENAILRYVWGVTDITKFSAQCVDSIAWLLAAYLAGPILKGDEGAQMAAACMKAYNVSMAQAMVNDANNRRRRPQDSQRSAPWIGNR
jgi:hypothetical protein